MSDRVVLRGSVAAFDERRGLGEVLAGDGRRFEFHATQITNDRRRISTGRAVTFVLRPGSAGRFEAAAVTELSPG